MRPERFDSNSPHSHHRGFGPRGFGPADFAAGFGPGFDPAALGAFVQAARGGRRRASRGDIRSALLSVLADGPANGYTLIKAILEKTDGLWRPSPGSVYPTLQQLVDEELVQPTGDGRGTEYALTDAGREYVAEHQAELDAAWDATPGRSETELSLFGSVGKLMGVIQQFRHGASEAQRIAATEKIDELRRALYLILAD